MCLSFPQGSDSQVLCPLAATARWKFYVREPRHAHPNWLKVGLTLGTCAFLWGYVSTPLPTRGREQCDSECGCHPLREMT
jgi:hypothetical protein